MMMAGSSNQHHMDQASSTVSSSIPVAGVPSINSYHHQNYLISGGNNYNQQ